MGLAWAMEAKEAKETAMFESFMLMDIGAGSFTK